VICTDSHTLKSLDLSENQVARSQEQIKRSRDPKYKELANNSKLKEFNEEFVDLLV
jgi:hypothetical protein